jgi:uncharacterized membrane protein
LVPASIVRPQLATHIAKRVPTWSDRSFICREDLHQFRSQYVQALLEEELSEVDQLERSVVETIAQQERAPAEFEVEATKGRTLGERAADGVARFGGSWRYLMLFTAFMIAWMGLNSLLLATGAFDPYPYIFLNLVLSCLSAVQAPIIMMSQNRQEARDRARAQNDHHVNLTAELEIRLLHEKMDQPAAASVEAVDGDSTGPNELMAEVDRQVGTRPRSA